jgi:uncharacterized protein (DUF58 family)
MWLYLIAIPLAVLIIAGSVLLGGAFTIVGIPLAVLALLLGALYRAIGHATVERGASRDGGSGPATPADLADARRARQ